MNLFGEIRQSFGRKKKHNEKSIKSSVYRRFFSVYFEPEKAVNPTPLFLKRRGKEELRFPPLTRDYRSRIFEEERGGKEGEPLFLAQYYILCLYQRETVKRREEEAPLSSGIIRLSHPTQSVF